MSIDVETELIVFIIAGCAAAEIVFIVYSLLRDINKITANTFVLKDENTVYFLMFLTVGLFFKILLIDTFYKDEINKDDFSCSIFVSDYVPQVFLVLAISVYMLKIIHLR